MGHVFISYSRRDAEVVEQIVSQLAKEGIEAWLDREPVQPEKPWRKQIIENIDTAEAFVLFLSPDSVSSDINSKELTLAKEAQQPFLLAVTLKETILPAELRRQLTGTPILPYYPDPKKGVRDLIEALKKKQAASAGLPPVKASGFREVEVVLENTAKESFGEKAKQELLKTLGEVIHGSIVDVAKNFVVVRVEEVLNQSK